MRVISGPHVHPEIVRLVDRARSMVVLVSPFVRTWPELRMALGRAVLRGVRVELFTREGPGGPSERDLFVFRDLDIPIRTVPRLHQKLYLSESEALKVSANLTSEAIDRAIEGGEHVTREHDLSGWHNAAELWLQTLDHHRRNQEAPASGSSPPADIADLLQGRLPVTRYCMACGAALQESDEAICLTCRATSVSQDISPEDIRLAHCPECGTEWPGASFERPLCPSCYRGSQVPPPAKWCVVTEPGAVHAWGPPTEADGAFRDAITSRLDLMLEKSGILVGEVNSPPGVRFDPWEAGIGPHDVSRWTAIHLERSAPRPMRLSEVVRVEDPGGVVHRAYRVSDTAPTSADWAEDRPLVSLDQRLPEPDAGRRRRGVDPWWLLVHLAVRAGRPAGPALDPNRILLAVDIHLTVPGADRATWPGRARVLYSALLQSLHPIEDSILAGVLSRLPGSVREKAGPLLASAAPLAPVPPVRDPKGRVLALGSRPDRVVLVRATATEGDRWAVRGSVSTVRRRRES